MTNIRYIDDYELTTEDQELSDWNNYDFIRNAIIDKMAIEGSDHEWIVGTADHEYKITTDAEDYDEDAEVFEIYKDGEFLTDGLSVEGVARITERPEKTIREWRIIAGLTQQEMSDLLGIPKRTIENWEGGQRSCPEWTERLIIDKLKQIAAEKK